MNNNTTKVNNPMKVITGPDTRWSYANVWEAKSINGGTPKYSVSLIILKSDTKTVSKIKAAIEAGRTARLAGVMAKQDFAVATTPVTGNPFLIN